MSYGLRRLATTTAGALAVALTVGSASPAVAQIDPSSLGEGGMETALEVIGSLPVGSTAELIGSVGSADFPLDSGSTTPLYGEPRPPKDVSQVAVIDTWEAEGYDYWLVDSVAMQREVVVEVMKSKSNDPAPVLYLLDGVDSPEGHSGWRSMADVDARPIANDNVHVVSPTGAYASYWTDWQSDDPLLGNYKWETFLTDELPGIVADQLEVTGKNAVGGISMGGQAAMHLAATYDMYDAVMSFSGNYSTMDQLGYQTLRLTIETRGADVNNMWGPHGSEQWRKNDTISHVDGLDGKGVFFSAGSGVLGPEDLAVYGADVQSLAVGMLLERGVLEGTTAFEQALSRADVEHEVVYTPTGAHNWVNFMNNFDAGWNYIKGDLGL